MPPCCWPRDEHRVEDATAVVDRDVAEQLDLAGLGVDLDDRDVRAERERRLTLVEVEGVRERRLHPRRSDSAPGSVRRGGELGPATARVAGTPGDAEPAVVGQHDVVDVRFEQVRGELARPSRARLRSRGTARSRRSAASASPSCRSRAGRARCRTARRVTRSIGIAEQLLDDHRERRLVTLAVGRRADGRGHAIRRRRPRSRRTPRTARRR